MSNAVVLLASRCPAVIDHVKWTTQEMPHLDVEVCSIQTAHSRAEQPDVGLILTHLGEGDEAGITRTLWSLAQAQRACPTVVLCDRTQEHQATALLGAGAADYVSIPSEMSRLRFLLSVLTQRFRADSHNTSLEQKPGPSVPGDGLERIVEQLRRVAPQETTVLLTGETGTGKTRLARLVHEMSPRRNEPFLVVDCGSLSATLIESELFGHAKGAFTGADRERQGKLAAAGRGTLLLDEINSLPLPLQAKLLRAVDERAFEPVGSDRTQTVRARLIAASNVPLEQEVSAGRFRSDLFYRLDVVGFHLPPLRERRGHILPLAESFLRDLAQRNGRPELTNFSDEARLAIDRYSWPGNVRELRNVVERAVALCPGDRIEWSDLPEQIRSAAPAVRTVLPPSTKGLAVQKVSPSATQPQLRQSKDEAEFQRIQEALVKHRNKRSRAARELGISRVGLYKKLRKYGLLHFRLDGADNGTSRRDEKLIKTIVPVLPETPI